MDLAFDIDGRPGGALSQPVAALIADNLRCYAAGPSHPFFRDVERLMRAGVEPTWVEGAQAAADVMEDAMVGAHTGPIPLDSSGKAAHAIRCALSLTGPASFDASSEHARLLNALREAQDS